MIILQVEGQLRHIANPHNEKRMELLLQNLLEGETSMDEEESDENDEVSFTYYGQNCSCSKFAKCKSSKCLCFLRGDKCTEKCHNNVKNNCSNN